MSDCGGNGVRASKVRCGSCPVCVTMGYVSEIDLTERFRQVHALKAQEREKLGLVPKQEVEGLDNDHCPLSTEERTECKRLAEKFYRRFKSIKFKSDGLIVISDDQGGWPIDTVTLKASAGSKAIAKACLAFMRALAEADDF